MITRYEDRGGFYYFDFLLDDIFNYNSYVNLDVHELFNIYTDFDVDQGWIEILSDIKTTFSIQIFDTFPIPDMAINSMRFIGSHIFTDFIKMDENLFGRIEDILYKYETGFSLDGLRIRRLGKVGEGECLCRVKMIWRKTITA